MQESVNPKLQLQYNLHHHSVCVCVCMFVCLCMCQMCMCGHATGIQQKYLLVTCNYPARARGVTKLMGITEAKKKCPELVLVSGEDLTRYREMSYQISGVQVFLVGMWPVVLYGYWFEIRVI